MYRPKTRFRPNNRQLFQKRLLHSIAAAFNFASRTACTSIPSIPSRPAPKKILHFFPEHPLTKQIFSYIIKVCKFFTKRGYL